MTCTFFGHRDAPDTIKPILRETVIDFIENKGVDLFYVGNQGAFDRAVIKVLRLLKEEYPHINYFVVLAYVTNNKDSLGLEEGDATVYPECLDKTPPKYAIIKRNRWMLQKSDFVITYVTRITSGAYEFKHIAERKGREVINLADINT